MSSFAAVKLLSLLVYPLGQIFVLGFMAFLFRLAGWVRLAFLTALLGFGWLYLCSTAQFADFLMAHLEEGYGSRPISRIDSVDAIVLLGGAMRGHTHLGSLGDMNQQADRLVHAVALYKAGKAPVILVSGGSPFGDRSEAEQMQDILGIMGVPEGAIILESTSRNTHENAVNSARILHERGLNNILLVTSAFHMRRAQALFDAQGGLNVEPAPTDFQRRVSSSALVPDWLPMPGVSNLYRSTHAIHEFLGIIAYRWRGWL